MFKKSKILAMSLGLMLTPTIVSFTTINFVNTKKLSSESSELLEIIKNDLLQKKTFLKNFEVINYNNQNFFSDEQLHEYLWKNKLVQTKLTSSNPKEVWLKSPSMDDVLDENLIYDLNFANFQEVYQNQWGGISLSLDQALNTYVNGNNIYQEYSYNDIDWYRTEAEALLYESKGVQINSSLYYLYKSQYFNVFNKEDNQALLNQMENGLYLEKTQKLSGEKLSKTDYIYGSYDNVRNNLKTRLRSEWFEKEYLDKITKVQNNNIVYVTPKKGQLFKIRYNSEYERNQKSNLPAEEMYEAGKKVNLYFPKTDFGSQDQLLNWFTNDDEWDILYEYVGAGIKYYRERKVVIQKDDKIYNATLLLVPDKAALLGQNNTPYISENYVNNAKQFTEFKFYYDSLQTKEIESFMMQNVKHYSELPTGKLPEIFDKWYLEYFQNIYLGAEANKNVRFTFDKLINNQKIQINEGQVDAIGNVYKDIFYKVNGDKSFKESLIVTYQEWLQQKSRILNRPILKDGQTYYQINEEDASFDNSLLLTRNQLDNYLPLSGIIPSLEMYSYSNQKDVSDPYGIMLSKTKLEAENKALINNSKALFTRFIYIDAFGNKIFSQNSEDDTIQKIKDSLILSSKFIHKDEIKSWKGRVDHHNFDDIIANGVYEVYGFETSIFADKKHFFYYRTKEQALRAFKKDVMINEKQYKKEIKALYLYEYENQQRKINITFTLDEIDQIAQKILNNQY